MSLVVAFETPEHVELDLKLAEPASRVVACALDLLLIALVLFVSFFVAVQFSFVFPDIAGALAMLAFFILRSFYFTLSEVWGSGRTLGKKSFGLRVIAADGGPLTAEQVVARNLTREFEIFLPLMVLLAPSSAFGGPWWVRLGLTVWVAGLLFLPLLTHRRQRLGDLLAGTVVVVEPAAELLEDLADTLGPADFVFEPGQLDIYGIKELQLLEGVLRRADSLARDQLLRGILDRVVTKIDWPETVPYHDAERFLYAFYRAQRHRLENRMLLGDRREEKVG